MKPFVFGLIASTSIAMSTSVVLADFDFKPYVSNNKIFAGGHDDELGVDVDVLRTGNYDFGEEAGDPYNIGDPGFNTVGASAFTPGSQLRLSGLAVQGSFLRYWNGMGSPNFSPAPVGVTLSLAGSPTRNITYAPGAQTYTPVTDTSLLIGSFSTPGGALHIHVTSSLFENGLQTQGSVPDGGYLISFSLINPGTGVAASDPFFIVFNNGLSDQANDAAVSYVNSTYAPEPVSISMIGLIATAMVGRQRSKRSVK